MDLQRNQFGIVEGTHIACNLVFLNVSPRERRSTHHGLEERLLELPMVLSDRFLVSGVREKKRAPRTPIGLQRNRFGIAGEVAYYHRLAHMSL